MKWWSKATPQPEVALVSGSVRSDRGRRPGDGNRRVVRRGGLDSHSDRYRRRRGGEAPPRSRPEGGRVDGSHRRNRHRHCARGPTLDEGGPASVGTDRESDLRDRMGPAAGSRALCGAARSATVRSVDSPTCVCPRHRCPLPVRSAGFRGLFQRRSEPARARPMRSPGDGWSDRPLWGPHRASTIGTWTSRTQAWSSAGG